MGAQDINELRNELRSSLDAADKWLGNEPALGTSTDAVNEALDQEWLTNARQTIRQLQVRASSSLINVAFVGGFSSGKSFLIGGLQNRLDYERVEGRGPNEIASERYIGLLFSAPRETTACPATIVPVDNTGEHDASDRGYLMVRFVDSLEWEGIGNSQPPAVVAAYTTQQDDIIINRLTSRHREREVAEVEILLGESSLPAKLYDLPGHGSLRPVHDEISNKAWADADCIVFVTQATQTLGKADDELIGRLHSHHIATEKKIIWVVTGIDRANVRRNLSDDKIAWQETRDTDTDYLKQRYPAPHGQINRFLGADGFIGVSPAWEAYGKWLLRQGREEEGRNYIAASHMSQLRKFLTDLIENDTGRRHIAQVAREARGLMRPRVVFLREMLDTARTPLDELAGERDRLSGRLQELQSAIPGVRNQLNDVRRAYLREFQAQFKGLADFLHSELDEKIREADLIKEREAASIDRRKAELLKEWQANRGPGRVWREKSDEFVSTAATRVQVVLRDTHPVDGLGSAAARVNPDQLRVPASERYRTSAQDILGQVSAVVGISTPVLGGLAAAAGIISGPFLAIPVGVTLAAALIYGVARRLRVKSNAGDLLRQAWIQSLDEQAKQYEAILTTAFAGNLTSVIDRAAELLAERATELSRKIILTVETLNAPDKAKLSELVARLDPFCDQGVMLISQLDGFISVGL
jgi:hypothetical protein